MQKQTSDIIVRTPKEMELVRDFVIFIKKH